MLDVNQIKKDFPIFQIHPELVYLDSAATSLKPHSVIEKEDQYYKSYSANVYRGIYKISEQATYEFEKTREMVGEFIHASRPEEIIFTRNTTESLNLVAYGLGRQIIESGDEIITTIMEHHSNFVPWQQLAMENDAYFKVIDIDENGYLKDLKPGDELSVQRTIKDIVTRKTKILAITLVSNTLGTINPVKEIIKYARQVNPNIITVVDAAQAMNHIEINVNDLDCDFLAFSSHKMLGPTGVGVLYGKYEILEQMYPFMYGGEMIETVSIEETTFKKPPHKFEAGTPHIAGVIAFKEAIKYLKLVGLDKIREHEMGLMEYAVASLRQAFENEYKILGPSNIEHRGNTLLFVSSKYHAHDIAQILDDHNIAIRAGHHCTMPLHNRLNIVASARATFALYNTKEDVDKLITSLGSVAKLLSE